MMSPRVLTVTVLRSKQIALAVAAAGTLLGATLTAPSGFSSQNRDSAQQANILQNQPAAHGSINLGVLAKKRSANSSTSNKYTAKHNNHITAQQTPFTTTANTQPSATQAPAASSLDIQNTSNTLANTSSPTQQIGTQENSVTASPNSNVSLQALSAGLGIKANLLVPTKTTQPAKNGQGNLLLDNGLLGL
jgi:hypothetical protein